ncbi:MAG: hypothetical protein K6U79_10065 [Firmicutes bacterium]|nr:hypothetical protein [Bacillota bacterium]
MIEAIVTRATEAAVASLVGADGHLEVVERGGGGPAVEAAARVPSDTLVVDADALPGIGPLVTYRLARPQSRAIVLAPGRSPGDGLLASVAALGIYDIVTDLEELSAVLARPPATLAQAIRWIDPSQEPGAQAATATRIEVVDRLVPLGARSQLIAVGGIAPGVGTTTVAAAIAGALARRWGVYLVEASQVPSAALGAAEPGEWVPRLAVVPGALVSVAEGEEAGKPLPYARPPEAWERVMEVLRARDRPYVVADLGTVDVGVDELWRLASRHADLTVLVGPGEPARFAWWLAWRWRARRHRALPSTVVLTGSGVSPRNWWLAMSDGDPGFPPASVRAVHFPRLEPRLRDGRWETPPAYPDGEESLRAAVREILGDLWPPEPEGRPRPKLPWLPRRK